MSSVRLFDDHERTDSRPARYGESAYTFLNRVDRPAWHRIRQQLNQWFDLYPADAHSDLSARFKSAEREQHYAAWWELYLFVLFRKLEYDVEVHPTIIGMTTKPDFLVSHGDESFYLEATVVFSDIEALDEVESRQNQICDIINEAHCANFSIGVEFGQTGRETPSKTEVLTPLMDWLNGLNPDAYMSGDSTIEFPEREVEFRDWRMTVTAYPIPPDYRSQPGRLLAARSYGAGLVNDDGRLRRKLDAKRSHYGRLNHPFVIAVSCMAPFIDDDDIAKALFGRTAYQWRVSPEVDGKWVRQRNGFWLHGTGPRGTRVSAVLIGKTVLPWTVDAPLPQLWVNPWAAHPVGDVAPFPSATADNQGQVTYTHNAIRGTAVLGLPDDWPNFDTSS